MKELPPTCINIIQIYKFVAVKITEKKIEKIKIKFTSFLSNKNVYI